MNRRKAIQAQRELDKIKRDKRKALAKYIGKHFNKLARWRVIRIFEDVG